MATQDGAERTFVILTLGAAGMAALLALAPAAGHDQLWFLLMAERWLGGAQLYGPQIFDSNTPAIVWLSAVPVLLARLLHVEMPAAGKLLVVLLEAMVAAAAWRLLPPLVRDQVSRAQRAFLAFVFVTLFAVVPARDFGQRDHLTALLLLPYLLAAGAGRRGRLLAAALATGLAGLAAAGVCLKPQLALVPLAVELYLLTRRRFRPEAFVFLAAGALFLAAIGLFAPLYFTVALPITRATYWAIGHLSPWQLLLQSPQLTVLAIFSLTRKPSARSARLPETLLCVAGVAATASYYLQGTGWYYQQLPAITFFGLALAVRLLTVRLRTPRWLPAAALGLTVLALALTFHFSGYPFALRPFTAETTYAIESPDPALFGELAPGTPVAILTTSVEDAMMPVFRYHLVWAQRTNNLWTLPAILRGTRLTAAQQTTLAAQQRRWMVEDLIRWRPRLILVARCQAPEVHCQTLEDRHDNLLAFFMQDPAFKQVFAGYHSAGAKGAYDAYTLDP